ncbi:hypothetical protein EDD22DRAFT_959095 [Suillus occidentalis]|nr:hypothetical protein EDD22DRAFT_959095 [Suillus occidentalis]
MASHNIPAKAKNFLVLQGEVEAAVSQSPRELLRPIEQTSGSVELSQEYETAKEAQERDLQLHEEERSRGCAYACVTVPFNTTLMGFQDDLISARNFGESTMSIAASPTLASSPSFNSRLWMRSICIDLSDVRAKGAYLTQAL